MSNELQNTDFILPGNLGEVEINNAVFSVESVYKKNDGSVTVSVSPFPTKLIITIREDETITPLLQP